MSSTITDYTPAPKRLKVDTLMEWLQNLDHSKVTIVIDSSVVDCPLGSAIRSTTSPSPLITWLPVDAERAATLEAANDLTRGLTGSELVIAIGGGRTIDSVKVAVALTSIPGLDDRIHTSASGVIMDTTPPSLELIAVPTTLGTGSERSQSAVVDTSAARCIVVGPCLRPDAYVLDPLASRGLPTHLVLAGVLEALTRTFGPAIGADRAGPASDVVLASVERLVVLGDTAVALTDLEGPSGDHVRAEIGQLSALSHGTQLHSGRSSSSFKAWFLVTELSWLAHISKADALARVMTPWMRAIARDDRWGSGEALESLRHRITAGDSAHSPTSVAEWFDGLLARWDLLTTRPLDVDPHEAAQRVVNRWGTPELLGLDVDTVLPIMKDAIGGAWS